MRKARWLALTFAIAGSVLRQGFCGENQDYPAEQEQQVTDSTSTEPVGISIEMRGAKPLTAASSQVVRDRDLSLRMLLQPSDIVKVTPGLYTGQHAGGGKANQYFLRGFDADHGTDIAFWLDGMPINLPSHAHGQGYSDLHFVIPELIDRVEVRKGPYFVEDGDFATAGAVHLMTRERYDENFVQVSGGSFETRRVLALVNSPSSSFHPTAAAEVYGSNGPFDNPENLQRYNVLLRGTLLDRPTSSLSLTFMSYGSGWNGSGQIPLREVPARRLSRFGSIDPTEGGNSQRHSASLLYRAKPSDQEEFTGSAYAISYRLALFSDFTFFLNDPVNGDEIEQDDQRTISGGNATYSLSREAWGKTWRTLFGASARNDMIHNELSRDVSRQRLNAVKNDDIREGSLAAFVQEKFSPVEWLRLVLGVRSDYYDFDVKDNLQVFSSTAPNTSGVRQQSILSPKLNAIFTIAPKTELYLNYGEGFHSNDARGVVDTSRNVTPLTKARGYEVGARTNLWNGLDVAAAVWRLDLDNEIVFSGDDGTTEVRGATRRIGGDVELRYKILPWLWADTDITKSKATFVENAGNGNAVALAPTLTVSGGLSARHPSGFFGSLRVEHIDDRPANEDGGLTAQGFTVFNLASGYRINRYELTLAVPNIFNTEWREAQFANTSRLKNEPAAGVEDIHFVPGTPRAILAGLRVYF